MKRWQQLFVTGIFCASSISALGVANAQEKALSLEYSSTTRVDGQKKNLAQVKTFVNAEPGRVRRLTKYTVDGSQMPKIPDSAKTRKNRKIASWLPDFGGHYTGGIGFIDDRQNDKITIYSDEQKSYVEEPRMELLKQLRFDPFSKVAPELSETEPPELTPEQRQRLGQELRVLGQAVSQDNLRIYFHELEGSRDFRGLDGVQTHGYRLGILFNIAPAGKTPQWQRIASEWWVADSLPGDELIRQYSAATILDLQNIGGISKSMWINETLPVLWESLPQEIRDAVQTYIPLPPDPNAGYRGTLAYFALTTQMQFENQPQQTVRYETTLNNRDTELFSKDIFVAPSDYEKQDISFLLAMYKGMSASLLDPQGLFSRIKNASMMKPTPFISPLAPMLDASSAEQLPAALMPQL